MAIKTKGSFFKKLSFEQIYNLYKGTKETQDEEGNTLAHHCVYHNRYDLLSQLKDLLKVENQKGLTPDQLARYLGRPLTVEKEVSLTVFKRKEQTFAEFGKEELFQFFGLKYLDHLEFLDPRNLDYAAKRVQKVLLNTEIKWKNHWTLCMHRAALAEKKFPSVYVKWIDPIIGYGLFAKEDIAELTLIGEYTGVVRKRKNREDRFNDYIFGYVVANEDTPFVIDAKEKGNYTRFLNHSDDSNLCSTWIIEGGICRVILFAKTFIPKDSQMTYDYGPYYWKKRSNPLLL